MNTLRGIVLKVLSAFSFTLMAMCIKAAAPHVPPGETVFFRSFAAIPVILAWLAWHGVLRHALVTRHPMGHAWRGVVGTTAMALNFTALGLLPLPEATTLFYTAPLFTVLLAALLLGEEVRIFRISALIFGLFGVVVILVPRLSVGSLEDASRLAAFGALAALLGAGFSALAQVFVRRLVLTEHTGAVVMYFTLTSTMLSLVTLPFGWVVPEGPEWLLMIGSGLFGGLGQILLTEAYRNAPASVVAPFDYTSMVFALIFGYLIFDEVPTRVMLTGAAMILGSGLFIIWREHRRGLERAGRKVTPPQG